MRSHLCPYSALIPSKNPSGYQAWGVRCDFRCLRNFPFEQFIEEKYKSARTKKIEMLEILLYSLKYIISMSIKDHFSLGLALSNGGDRINCE